jgi:hypothetical protein
MTDLEGELVDLNHRIDRLEFYIESDEFRALESAVRSTIATQFLAMNQYAACLRMRLLVAITEETELKDESNEQSDPAT